MPDNGTGLERREAPGPTSLGPRARKRHPLVTGDLPWRAPNPVGFGTRGDPRVAPPGAPFPFWGNGKRETTGRPGRPNSKPGFAECWPDDAPPIGERTPSLTAIGERSESGTSLVPMRSDF